MSFLHVIFFFFAAGFLRNTPTKQQFVGFFAIYPIEVKESRNNTINLVA